VGKEHQDEVGPEPTAEDLEFCEVGRLSFDKGLEYSVVYYKLAGCDIFQLLLFGPVCM
jgi:hypothetical protein